MVLEATMVVLDTSEYMRNGDYYPSRLIAAQEAASVIFNAKTRDNPETTVGLMTLGGTVKVSFVNEPIKFQAGVRETEVDGQTKKLGSAIQVAQLALRHRQNRNQRQRIIVILGSPVEDDANELLKLAAKLKKNNVAVDIIHIGQEGDSSVLDKFINAVDSTDNSKLLYIPPESGELSDIVKRSAILTEGGNDAPADFDFEDDPELAMALRMSLEEEQQRQLQSQNQN